jgi:hypothetical protein
MSNHIIISGAGRSGTTFLVQYLNEIGFDTHLRKDLKNNTKLDINSNAGYEDYPFPSKLTSLPYVIKSPWISFQIEQLAAQENFHIDCIILPIRDLVESSVSRVTLEMQAIHKKAEWMSELNKSFDTWGETSGGVVYSLNPIDQARILATAFFNIVEYATSHEIPLIFLSFPRIVEDPEYLYKKLSATLKLKIDLSSAIAVHHKIANIKNVRVGKELEQLKSKEHLHESAKKFPSLDLIEINALKRKLIKLRNTIAEKDNTIAEKDNTIAEKDNTISLLKINLITKLNFFLRSKVRGILKNIK